MTQLQIEDQTFEAKDFSTALTAEAYENCTFLHCSFTNADLSNLRFVECVFKDCDLSNAKLHKTTLNDIKFIGCKLLGLHFENCSEFLFTVSFENCAINFSSFYKRSLKKTIFKNSSLQEVDFTEADLTNSTFDNCDLSKALFENTVLERADLRTAYNYSVDPELNRIKKARFSATGIPGLLTKYDIVIE